MPDMGRGRQGSSQPVAPGAAGAAAGDGGGLRRGGVSDGADEYGHLAGAEPCSRTDGERSNGELCEKVKMLLLLIVNS